MPAGSTQTLLGTERSVQLDGPANDAAPKAFVVGVAGASGTGKSTVARQIAFRLNGHAISMETYSACDPALSFDVRSRLNYDEPEAIDLPLLESHIRHYAAGFPIESPVYDFGRHLRLERTTHVAPKALLIVEGILALHFAELRPHYQLSIYLEASEESCFRRRQVRDITERQRPLELIRWQYETTVLPAARKYLPASKRYADVVIDSNPNLSTVVENVSGIISARCARAATAR